MVFMKQLKPRIFVQCNVAKQTGALPFKVRVVGSIPLPGTGSFFFLPFPPLLSLLSLHCAFTQVSARLWRGLCESVERVLRVYLAGLLL